MELSSYFVDFLSNIRLTPNQVSYLVKGHRTLRDRLKNYEDLSDQFVDTFLQGSYIRATAVRPKGGKRSDVDVVVVTRIDTDEYTPDEALNLFEPFLKEYYDGKYRIQGRSLGICLKNVDLDIVVTSAPSEIEEEIVKKSEKLDNLNIEDMFMEPSDSRIKQYFLETFAKKQDSPEWKNEPLCIPNREAQKWEQTNPLEQIRWTVEKNNKTNGHYVNVVKALKWWKKVNYPDGPVKSYPLEHFIGNCCPDDDITSVAKGITLTLEDIVSNYKSKPYLEDHGVPNHDVFGRISNEEYQEFYSQVSEAALIAREALDSNNIRESALKWKELFGSKFPDPPQVNNGGNGGGFTKRTEKTANVPGRRFA